MLLRAGETFHLPPGVYHLPANGGEGELEFEAVLTPGLESGAMFRDLYAVLRAHRGFAQFVRVSLVFRSYTSALRFRPPVRAVMRLVAAIARLCGVRTGERLPAEAIQRSL